MEKVSAGIVEVKEVLKFAELLGVAVISEAKDGLQMSDVLVLLSPELLESGQKAIAGYKNIQMEMKDLEPSEISELAQIGLSMVFAMIAAAKK